MWQYNINGTPKSTQFNNEQLSDNFGLPQTACSDFWSFRILTLLFFLSLICGTEYCERFAKKENIVNSTADEESGDEEISEEESESSDDDIAGHADP